MSSLRARWRGSWAAYLNVEHPDIEEFLQIRSEGHPIQDVSFAVCIGNDWMQSMIDGDQEKRAIMAKIHKKRSEIGYPYIFFTDNVNEQAPQWYKDKKMKIKHSQLCAEIAKLRSNNKSFVCCLSSMNALHYEEWHGTDAVGLMAEFLDAVYSEFIIKARDIPFMEKAVRFARDIAHWYRCAWLSLLPAEQGHPIRKFANSLHEQSNLW